ncbi:MAG: hypothetical protein NVS2B14_05250 [Chamaesiphon sp.]
MQVSATEGEIQQDGQKVFLKGQILATDPRNGIAIKGQELEWRPKEDLLIVHNLIGGNSQLQASGKEAQYLTRTQHMELQGQIVAIAKDPLLQLKTEHLIWQIPQKKIIGDRSMEINQYKGQTAINQVVGNAAEVNLKTKIVTLQHAHLGSIDPLIQMTSKEVTWNLNAQTVVSNQPVTIWQPKEQVTVTANRGQVDLQQKVAFLNGNVQAAASSNQSQLFANQLKWEMSTQQIQGWGNVIYKRINPPLSLTGSMGVGKLQDQSFVVTSSNGGRVVTEIFP